MNNNATIAAISTPPGKGGVAVIRISGDRAIEIAEKIFLPRSKKTVSDVAERTQIYGDILYCGEIIDDGMLTVFKAPFSYTGENTAEISCHGGILITEKVLESALCEGAQLAAPGEFTKRAFINGKLTLTETEAISALLEAESTEQIRLSSRKSRKLLSNKIDVIREGLCSVLSSMYARIDYPDEDLGDFSDEEMLRRLKKILFEMEDLKRTYKTGKAVNEGIKTVICGKPNVGKSSVYNLLIGRDAAIVTDIKGTTRDVLTEKIPLGKVMLSLSDTAGIRASENADPIERIGIERSYNEISQSELILAVFDRSAEIECEDEKLLSDISKFNTAKIAILNKSDKHALLDKERLAGRFDTVIEVSALAGAKDAYNSLLNAVSSLFTDEKIVIGNEAIISSARQNAELTRAISHLRLAIEALEMGISQDATSSDIERALGAIAELDGISVTEEIITDIFSKFCVGK